MSNKHASMLCEVMKFCREGPKSIKDIAVHIDIADVTARAWAFELETQGVLEFGPSLRSRGLPARTFVLTKLWGGRGA